MIKTVWGSDIYSFFFSISAHFSKHVVPLFSHFPFKWQPLLKCRPICSQRGVLPFSFSFSFGVQLRGLVCARVPRIMITAAEKHILTFQEIRAGNLQADDLTSSLWLIVGLREESPPPGRAPYPTSGFSYKGQTPFCTTAVVHFTQRDRIWVQFPRESTFYIPVQR